MNQQTRILHMPSQLQYASPYVPIGDTIRCGYIPGAGVEVIMQKHEAGRGWSRSHERLGSTALVMVLEWSLCQLLEHVSVIYLNILESCLDASICVQNQLGKLLVAFSSKHGAG